MIVKMHRVTLLVSARDREASLQRLRDLGVVHVDAAATGSEDVQAVEAEMENVDQALRILGAEDGDPGSEIGEAPSHLEEILGLTRQRDELSRERDRIQEQSQWFGDWGAVGGPLPGHFPAGVQRVHHEPGTGRLRSGAEGVWG